MSYFWSGYVLHDFLFKGLDAESIPGLIGVCVGIFSVALLYEGVRSLKSILVQNFSENGANRRGSPRSKVSGGTNRRDDAEVLTSGAPENGNLESLVQNSNATASSERRKFNNGTINKISHLFMASSFHAVYVFLGFSLMNAVMTFNIYIFISAILGIGLGYFFFYDCSRLKFPYGITNPDVAQCQALLPPPDEMEDNLENGGPNNIGTSAGETQTSAKRVPSNDNELIVKAEIYNVPSPTNGQVL